MGVRTPPKAGTPSKKGCKGRQEPQEGGDSRDTKGVQTADTPSKKWHKGTHQPRRGAQRRSQDLRKADTPSKNGQHGSQDPPASNTTREVVQRESRPSRRQTPSKKGHNGSQKPREGGHTIQWESKLSGRRTHNRRRGTKGVKTLRKADTPSNTIQEGEHTGYRGSQDCREGGHTIQHHAGHLNIALRTPNSTLFGENAE